MLRNKSQIQNPNFKSNVLSFGIRALCLFCILCFGICHYSFAQEQFVYDAKGKRDPFIPLVTPDGRLLKLGQEEGISELSLEGIFYDQAGGSYLIVNGEVVRVGEKIGDYQVLKIEKKKATFLKNGEPIEVKLKGEEE
jgi:hypothetical protein